MEEQNSKNEYAKAVSLFLAELLRTRKTSLDRAAEIAQKVVENINLIDTEDHFLKFAKELTADFDEMNPFEERVHIHIHISDRRDLERKVRTFATHLMSSDMNQALAILHAALNEETKMPELCAKFPQFKEFIESNTHQWTKNRS